MHKKYDKDVLTVCSREKKKRRYVKIEKYWFFIETKTIFCKKNLIFVILHYVIKKK